MKILPSLPELASEANRRVAAAANRKLSTQEAARYLGLSKSFLDKARLSGSGPAYLKLARRVLYDIDDLEAWALSHKRQHTSEAK